MCLPFICGGDHRGDHGSPGPRPLPPPRPPHLSPPPALSPPPRFVPACPVNDSHDHRTPRIAAGGGEARNGGADAVPWHVAGGNKNGKTMMGIDTRDAGVPAPAAGFHGSVAASHPKESTDRMRAPPVPQMAPRGGAEDNYPAAAAARPSPEANNFYGGHGHGYDGHYAYGDRDNRNAQGNSWW
ncbi:unnamed protein product [Urochloa humidicola]